MRIKLPLLPLAALCLAACNADNMPTPEEPETTDPILEYHWIPNWATDTLYCILSPSDGTTIRKDSLFTFSKGDTSFISYKGVRYYVWTCADPFVPNAKTYNNSYIGTQPFNVGTALAGHIRFVIEPGRYFSEASMRLENQEQLIEDRGFYYFPAPPFQESVKIFSTKYKSW